MKKLSPLFSILILAPFTANAGGLPPDCRYSDGGQNIRSLDYYLSDMEQFERNYQAAPSGSFEEQRAKASRDQAGQYALSFTDAGTLSTYAHEQLNTLHLSMESKYQAARTNSYPESIYKSVRDSALTAFEQKGLENLRCLYGDIRTIDQYAMNYESLYQAARTSSRIESIYLNLRNATLLQSESILDSLLPRMSGGELDQLEREYEAKYQAARTGSRLESHAKLVRDKLRAEILSRGAYPAPRPPIPQPPRPQPPRPPVPTPPRPVPPTPPRVNCPPGTVYKASLGRCVAPTPVRRY